MRKALLNLWSFITGWKKQPPLGAPDFTEELPPEERIH
jgi:hypothetical protein